MFHKKTSFSSFSISVLSFLLLRLQNERKTRFGFFFSFLLVSFFFSCYFLLPNLMIHIRIEDDEWNEASKKNPSSRFPYRTHSHHTHVELPTSIISYWSDSKNNSNKKHRKINWTSTFLSDPESIKTNLLAGSNGFSFQVAINCCMFSVQRCGCVKDINQVSERNINGLEQLL